MFGCHPKQREKFNQRKAKTMKTRHQAWMLVYKGPNARTYKHCEPHRKLAIVKGNMEMKWHPASKAQKKALEAIKEQQMNPGLGWKIQIVTDTSLPPPKAPKPPPLEIIDDPLPQAQFVSKQDWKWIVNWEWHHKKPTPYNKELNETCAGCLKKTCLKKKDLEKAIELA